MKKVLILMAIAGMTFISSAHAGRMGTGGVKRIANADSGRYMVYCQSGSMVIGRVRKGWGDSSDHSFGESYYGLSIEEAAAKGCG